MSEPCGLRDRKKANRRASLASAAFAIAVEQGLEAATVDAITGRVGVSPRTFHNYFSSRDEAIAWRVSAIGREWIGLLRDRPAGEDIWDSVDVLAADVLRPDHRTPEELFRIVAMLDGVPEGVVHRARVEADAIEEFGDVIAERTGTDPVRDVFPRLARMVIIAAMKASLELFLDGAPGDRTLLDLFRECMRDIRTGLKTPTEGI